MTNPPKGFLNSSENWVVIIEWDGQVPPTKWYRYLDKLAGGHKKGGDYTSSVRGKGASAGISNPLERRAGGEYVQGIVAQEGCIICQSQSSAVYIANFAKYEIGEWMETNIQKKGSQTGFYGKAPTVLIGTLDLSLKGLLGTSDALELVERTNKVLGKMGRKPPSKTWAVTCLECLQVGNVKAPRAINCPKCSGLRIHTREGTVAHFKDDPNIPVFEIWKRTRFFGAHFEPAICTEQGEHQAPKLDKVEIFSSKEDDAYRSIASSTLPSLLEKADRQIAFDILDAVLASRSHYDSDTRKRKRVEAVTAYFLEQGKQGKQPSVNISLIELQPDIIDAALLLGVDKAVTYQIHYGE